MKLLSFILALALIVSSVFVPEAIGAIQLDYNPLTMYLSELGADGAPHASLINSFGFLATGILTVLMLALARQRLPRHSLISIGLLACLGVAVGYLGAYAFPCDPGCPAEGSARQNLHNISGLIGYLGAITGLGLIALGLHRMTAPRVMAATLLALALVVFGFTMMVLSTASGPIGLWQRFADYGFFVWLAVVVTAPRSVFRKGGSFG